MTSNKNRKAAPKRAYTLKARARRRDEVHLRITKATVQLHGTVGPARTTVSEIAKIAGVRRATVYNHFPTDLELIDACSAHWFADNPPPDPEPWLAIADPHERTITALGALYAYYDQGQGMLEKVLRDGPLVPALDEILQQKWRPMMDGIVAILETGWEADPTRLKATLRVAVEFGTWQKLVGSGLSNRAAAGVAAGWVGAK